MHPYSPAWDKTEYIDWFIIYNAHKLKQFINLFEEMYNA